MASNAKKRAQLLPPCNHCGKQRYKECRCQKSVAAEAMVKAALAAPVADHT